MPFVALAAAFCGAITGGVGFLVSKLLSSNNTAAPDSSRIKVKEFGSNACDPRAKRHSIELAAKQTMAQLHKAIVFPKIALSDIHANNKSSSSSCRVEVY